MTAPDNHPTDWQDLVADLASRSLAADSPTGWFEPLYQAGRSGAATMPWDRGLPYPLLTAWTRDRSVDGRGRSAVVVGCGLGEDAEHLASLGFRTTAFDVAPSAVDIARTRRPGSAVDYHVADLFDPPQPWLRAFDLVVDVFTVQALPRAIRGSAVAAVAELVAPGGSAIEIGFWPGGAGQPTVDQAADDAGPPWPLTSADLDLFTACGLAELSREVLATVDGRRWRAEFRRRKT